MSGVPSWARVGAKVVCIEQDEMWDFPHITPPSVGMIYTIRRVGRSSIEFAPLISLQEHYAVDGIAGEVGFDIHCFRPVIEPKTEAEDLATFRKLLSVDQPQGEDA